MSIFKCAFIIELLWIQCRRHGALVRLATQTRLPAPQIEINAINQWSFVNFQNVKLSCTNVKPLY